MHDMRRTMIRLALLAAGLATPWSLALAAPLGPSDPQLQLVVRIRSLPAQAERLRELLRQLVDPSREEPGCLAYELHESATTPGLFLLHERWRDRWALSRHLRSPRFLAVSGELERQGLLATAPEVIVDPVWRPLEAFLAGLSEPAGGVDAGSEASSGALLFAPGRISTGAYELNAAFSNDGNELYFARSMPVFPFPNTFTTILRSERQDAGWSAPQVVSFSGIYSDLDPYLSADGSSLYFMSNRPQEGEDTTDDYDLWVVERAGSDWGAPRSLGPTVNSAFWEGYPAIAASGNLYFFSGRPGGLGPVDIYFARWLGDRFAPPENLGPSVNSAAADTNVYVDPGERFLIFSSSRLGSPRDPFERMDLFVSFRDGEGWTAAESLEAINTPGWEFTPMVTPDGKYLFFTRATPREDRRHLHGRALTSHELDALVNGPGNGLGDLFFIAMSALRPEWKRGAGAAPDLSTPSR